MEGVEGVLGFQTAHGQGYGLLTGIALHRQAHRPDGVVGVEGGAVAVGGIEGFGGMGEAQLGGQQGIPVRDSPRLPVLRIAVV